MVGPLGDLSHFSPPLGRGAGTAPLQWGGETWWSGLWIVLHLSLSGTPFLAILLPFLISGPD